MLSDPHPAAKEIIGIDLMRFACALGVMASHLLTMPDAHYHWAISGASGVEIFFVISGFIIPYSAAGSDSITFLRSRIVRLWPGIVICSTLACPALFYLDTDSAKAILFRYVRSVTLFPVGPWFDYVLWTLFVEIGFYAVVFAMLALGIFRKIGTLATLLGGIGFLYWSAFYAAQILFPDARWAVTLASTGFSRILDMGLVHHGAFFGIGINLWLAFRGDWSSRIPSLLLCAAAGSFEIVHDAIEISAVKGETMDLAVQLTIVAVAIGLIAISAIANPVFRSVRLRRLTRWLGLATFPLYLIHAPLGRAQIIVLERCGFTAMESAWLAAVTMICLAIAIALLIEPRLQTVVRQIFDRVRPRSIDMTRMAQSRTS